MRKKIFIVFLCISLTLLSSCTVKRQWYFEKAYTDVKKYL